MRRIALGFGIAVLASPLHAQELDRAGQRLDIAAQAPAACVLAAAAPVEADNAAFSATGANGGQIAIRQLVDANTATSLASSVRLDLPLVCNASHRILLRSANGGLLRAGGSAVTAVAGGFAEFMPYRFGLGWAGQELDRSSDQGEASINADRPASGSVELRVATLPGQGPLVAGQYSDTIVVEFQPAN